MAEGTEEELAGIARSCLKGFHERLADIDIRKLLAGAPVRIIVEILCLQFSATRIVFKKYRKVVELYLCSTAVPVGDVRYTEKNIWTEGKPG